MPRQNRLSAIQRNKQERAFFENKQKRKTRKADLTRQNKKNKNEKTYTFLITNPWKKPLDAPPATFNDQVADSNHEVSKASLVLNTIEESTARSYLSCYRGLSRMINDLSPENRDKLKVSPIPVNLLKKGWESMLCFVLGKNVSEEFWVQFVHFRIAHGLPNISHYRTALLKAQQASDAPSGLGDKRLST